ncbi:MAG: hypothetical protein R6V60_09910 [Desulfobacterales bacterium]
MSVLVAKEAPDFTAPAIDLYFRRRQIRGHPSRHPGIVWRRVETEGQGCRSV